MKTMEQRRKEAKAKGERNRTKINGLLKKIQDKVNDAEINNYADCGSQEYIIEQLEEIVRFYNC